MENVNHPAHYQGKHECIDEMIALFGEDLDKANWYMDKLIELEGAEK